MLQQCLPLAVLKHRDLQITLRTIKPLQQCLPLAVLKHKTWWWPWYSYYIWLQQCLPLAVLKQGNHILHISLLYRNVATVLTACGIETTLMSFLGYVMRSTLQQCLPLAVLKHHFWGCYALIISICCNSAYRLRYWNKLKYIELDKVGFKLQQCLPLAVLKLSELLNVCHSSMMQLQQCLPLAVLKLKNFLTFSQILDNTLQQCLPLAVLKRILDDAINSFASLQLQQCLPLAVLKHNALPNGRTIDLMNVATLLTACGIETSILFILISTSVKRCNSTYRLRYWNCVPNTNAPWPLLSVATVLTVRGMRWRVRDSREATMRSAHL